MLNTEQSAQHVYTAKYNYLTLRNHIEIMWHTIRIVSDSKYYNGSIRIQQQLSTMVNECSLIEMRHCA